MLTPYKDQIKYIIDKINIDSDNKIRLSDSEKWLALSSLEDRNSYFKDYLYQNFYCLGTNKKEVDLNKKPIESYDEFHMQQQKFVRNLRECNQSVNRLDKGWKVVQQTREGSVYIEKGEFKRVTRAGSYLRKDPFDSALQNGELVTVSNLKEAFSSKDLFYHVFGNTMLDDKNNLVRYYFNLKAEGAGLLVKLISEKFNNYQIPFQFKCINHPDYYDRVDSAVLYINKRYANYIFQFLELIYTEIEEYLEEGVPLFTCQLMRGIGFAENPPNNDSFGFSRCKLLAEKIIEFSRTKVIKSKWSDEIINFLNDLNFDINKFYLNPSSHYPYSFV